MHHTTDHPPAELLTRLASPVVPEPPVKKETFAELLARFFNEIERLRGLKYQDCGEVADAEQEIAALVESDRPDEAGVHEAFDKLRIALTEKRMDLEQDWQDFGRYEYAADNAPTPRYFRGM